MRTISSSLKTTILSTTIFLVTGCATQSEPEEYATAQPSCRHDMKMQCFERRGQVTKCRCVTDGEMEEMLEDLVNIQIQ